MAIDGPFNLLENVSRDIQLELFSYLPPTELEQFAQISEQTYAVVGQELPKLAKDARTVFEKKKEGFEKQEERVQLALKGQGTLDTLVKEIDMSVKAIGSMSAVLRQRLGLEHMMGPAIFGSCKEALRKDYGQVIGSAFSIKTVTRGKAAAVAKQEGGEYSKLGELTKAVDRAIKGIMSDLASHIEKYECTQVGMTHHGEDEEEIERHLSIFPIFPLEDQQYKWTTEVEKMNSNRQKALSPPLPSSSTVTPPMNGMRLNEIRKNLPLWDKFVAKCSVKKKGFAVSTLGDGVGCSYTTAVPKENQENPKSKKEARKGDFIGKMSRLFQGVIINSASSYHPLAREDSDGEEKTEAEEKKKGKKSKL